MAKIAGDLALMSQTELGEAAEATSPGKGGSSTLPHKRNPVDVTFARAAAQLALNSVPLVLSAMAQEHERAAGAWQAEWAALPNLFCYTAGAVARVRAAVSALELDAGRMRANLDLTNGLVMAESLATTLAQHMGRPSAQRIVQVACEQAQAANGALLGIALATPEITAHLSAPEIERALDPLTYLGSTDAFIDRAVDGYRQVLAEVEQR
jgi:3-carboxy-cis,cis-muconate cycloisomerase